MAYIHWELALLTFVVVPIILWVAMYFSGKMMTRTWRQLFRSVGQFNARIEDALGGVRVVKAFANEDHERSLFAVNNQLYQTTKLTAYNIMAKGLSLNNPQNCYCFYRICYPWNLPHFRIPSASGIQYTSLSIISCPRRVRVGEGITRSRKIFSSDKAPLALREMGCNGQRIFSCFPQLNEHIHFLRCPFRPMVRGTLMPTIFSVFLLCYKRDINIIRLNIIR